MDKNYSIDSTDGVTVVRFYKRLGIDEIRNAIIDVAENHLSDLRLWDFSKADINLTSSQIEELAKYGKSKFSIPSKVAIVAPEDLAFGLMRIYEVYREEDQAEIKVFRSEQDAWVWLRNPDHELSGL